MTPLIWERVSWLNNLYNLISLQEYGIVSIRKIPVLGGGK